MEADTSLTLTRRRLFRTVLSFLAVAPFSSNKSLFGGVQDDVLLAEFVAHDDRGVIGHTRGTKLEFFLRSRGIKPAHLARDSGYGRQHLLRIRMGRMEPTRRCIVDIVESCRRLSRETVTAANLFELDPRVSTHRRFRG
ncbi:MAG: hypothetical protein QOK37_311 [Thermoanaerobaculia bacterium]|jgi:hypothetical protein|nr:hypothetical protein [Thermoanaerobaculia bacterium]